MLKNISINFEVTITFLAIWLVDAACLSGDMTITFFCQMAAYRIAIMNNDTEEFGYDSMQQRTKDTKFMKSTSIKTFKVKCLTCDVFVFYKNLLCRLRSSCLHQMERNNGVKCK